jgi:hypothetical protein
MIKEKNFFPFIIKKGFNILFSFVVVFLRNGDGRKEALNELKIIVE